MYLWYMKFLLTWTFKIGSCAWSTIFFHCTVFWAHQIIIISICQLFSFASYSHCRYSTNSTVYGTFRWIPTDQFQINLWCVFSFNCWFYNANTRSCIVLEVHWSITLTLEITNILLLFKLPMQFISRQGSVMFCTPHFNLFTLLTLVLVEYWGPHTVVLHFIAVHSPHWQESGWK